MINIPPIKSSTAIKTELVADISKTWKVGQILNATTPKGGNASTSVLIRLGSHTLQAQTPVKLEAGQDIKLLVKTLGDVQAGRLPLLSILPPVLDAPAKHINAAIKLRQFIAIQQSFSQTLQLSKNIVNNKALVNTLPDSLKTALNIIQSTLQIHSDKLSSTHIKQLISNSGIFFEAKTFQQPSLDSNNSIRNDFKFQLLSIQSELNTLLQNTPKTLTLPKTLESLSKIDTNLTQRLISTLPPSALSQLSNLLAGQKPDVSVTNEIQLLAKIILTNIQQQPQSEQALKFLLEQLSYRSSLLELGQNIDQSISKLTSLQLQPLTREGDNFLLLLFNLVFKDSEENFDVNFRIQQDDANDDEDLQSWSIILHFDFRTLGKVQSKLNLIGNQLSTVFYAEKQSTFEKIQSYLPLLKSNLEKSGFRISTLSIKNFVLENESNNQTHVSILDEKA